MPRRNGRNSEWWNPLVGWQLGEAYLKNKVDEECSKINSMSSAQLSKYINLVTTQKVGHITIRFWHCLAFDENPDVDPETLVITVKSILSCIQSRLKGNC